MGFYPPDALVHEAQRRGIEVLPPDVNASEVGCTVDGGRVRCASAWATCWACAATTSRRSSPRASGRAVHVGRGPGLAGGRGRAALEQLAWSGACDALARRRRRRARRRAAWALARRIAAVAARGRAPAAVARSRARSWRCRSTCRRRRRCRRLRRWDAMIADYATTGLTTGAHPLALLRAELTRDEPVTSADLATLPHGTRVRVGGLVVARQRPGTAKGVVFLLLEDEARDDQPDRPAGGLRARPPARAHRAAGGRRGQARAPPGGGGRSTCWCHGCGRWRRPIARWPRSRTSPTRTSASSPGCRASRPLPGDDFRAVAPPAMSFGQGRRR